MKSIPASAWNRLMAFLARHQILGATVRPRGGWRHPWQLSPKWDAEREQWMTTIEPGFVNGLDAVVLLPYRDAPQETRQRLQGNISDEEESIDAWLTERPLLPLTTWRAIGTDALVVSDEPVPAFFENQGVASTSGSFEVGEVRQISGLRGERKPSRLLRAAELMLYQDRFATNTQWQTGLGFDGTNAQFSVTYQLPSNARQRAYLRLRASAPVEQPVPQQDRLLGDWTDQSYDSLHLATVYMLSPPDEPPDALPDSRWTPYVRHRVFWNLVHAVTVLEPALKRENLTLSTGTVGGLLDSIGNQILALINDQNAAIAEFLNRNTLQGRFWSI